MLQYKSLISAVTVFKNYILDISYCILIWWYIYSDDVNIKYCNRKATIEIYYHSSSCGNLCCHKNTQYVFIHLTQTHTELFMGDLALLLMSDLSKRYKIIDSPPFLLQQPLLMLQSSKWVWPAHHVSAPHIYLASITWLIEGWDESCSVLEQ